MGTVLPLVLLVAAPLVVLFLLARRRAALQPAPDFVPQPTGRDDDDDAGDTTGPSRRVVPTDRVYVGNLAARGDASVVRRRFAEFGRVVEFEVVDDDETGRFRGFVFVTMSSPAEAQAAIEALDGMIVAGRVLRVNAADPRGRQGRHGKDLD